MENNTPDEVQKFVFVATYLFRFIGGVAILFIFILISFFLWVQIFDPNPYLMGWER